MSLLGLLGIIVVVLFFFGVICWINAWDVHGVIVLFIAFMISIHIGSTLYENDKLAEKEPCEICENCGGIIE